MTRKRPPGYELLDNERHHYVQQAARWRPSGEGPRINVTTCQKTRVYRTELEEGGSGASVEGPVCQKICSLSLKCFGFLWHQVLPWQTRASPQRLWCEILQFYWAWLTTWIFNLLFWPDQISTLDSFNNLTLFQYHLKSMKNKKQTSLST